MRRNNLFGELIFLSRKGFWMRCEQCGKVVIIPHLCPNANPKKWGPEPGRGTSPSDQQRDKCNPITGSGR